MQNPAQTAQNPAQNSAQNQNQTPAQNSAQNQNQTPAQIERELNALDAQLADNIWVERYENFNTYKRIASELEATQRALAATPDAPALRSRAQSLQEQLELLKDYEKSPFSSLLTFGEVEPLGKITNPFVLFSAFSYIREVGDKRAELRARREQLASAIAIFERKVALTDQLAALAAAATASVQNTNNADTKNAAQNADNAAAQNAAATRARADELRLELRQFGVALDVAKTSYALQEKKLLDALANAHTQIKDQIKLSAIIFASILVVILLGFLVKILAKRFVQNNTRTYTIAKFTNVVVFTLVFFILLFGYIENVSYVVTILGFASAGLAIAMKDMFMSILGWCVIFFGGSFNVGDRVRVRWQNSDYVGDIIDIGLLRMTIYEDITLTSYRQNRRSGRIIFIPNNYIFTELIANYTHSGMKTVWDGIDIMLTFDSNHKKAAYIIKEIARKYSKGYTDIARRQMNRLRDRYSIKNPNVEPRIFTFFEPYGMCVSVWFMTNSYSALALRSTISGEIIAALNLEDDIKIAYPVQTLQFARRGSVSLELPDVSKELLY